MSAYIDFRTIAENYLSENSKSNLYFLLDHSGMPGLHRELIHSAVEWTSLFQGTQERNAIPVAPILLLAGANGRLLMGRTLFNWLSENGTYTSAVLLIASVLPIKLLTERLAMRLDVRLSENMGAMLRFFDPRVFEALIKVLSVEQTTAFFSPAHKWWYVDRSGELVAFEAEFSLQEELQPPLTLSDRQEFALIAASEPDQVLALLRANAPNLMIKLPLNNQSEFVARFIQTARNSGLDATSDLMLYCAVVLAMGENFTNGTLWRNVLNDVRTRHTRFAEAVAKIDIDEKLEVP